MAEIINLRRERKRRARAEAGAAAETARAIYGRTKAEREARKAFRQVDAEKAMTTENNVTYSEAL